MVVKKLLKIVGIAFVVILIRSMLQGIIPVTHQNVFQKSVFVINGTLPLVFIFYGTVAFTAIGLMFQYMHRGMGGGKIEKGFKTGGLYALIWTVFLIEPLPHGSFVDMFSYPIADSIVIVILGLMVGGFLSKGSEKKMRVFTRGSIRNIGIMTLFFACGRLILYKGFNIYSMFESAELKTILWVICTGVSVGIMNGYLKNTIQVKSVLMKSLIFGGGYFGINLFFFNFFLPLVLRVDILDLSIRTFVDITFVTIGSLFTQIHLSSGEKKKALES